MTNLPDNPVLAQTQAGSPLYVHPDGTRIPVSEHISRMQDIPPSKMFLIKQSLANYLEKNPGSKTFDASQGDGGASLPGVPKEILQRAFEIQMQRGTSYTMPFGTPEYRTSVIEQYWKLDSKYGLGPANVIATQGGRDGLTKAFRAMLALGHGRQGDVLLVTRVPWISYNWGPYGVGANVMLAPGTPENGWGYTEESIRASVAFAEKEGRKVAGMLITNPDNPTGRTIPAEEQAALAKAALEAGVGFVLFDWMYHFVTDEEPMDLNEMLDYFTPEERKRIMFLDGLTKSLGASNIRNCHLIAPDEVTKFIVARASHNVIPSFYSLAVAMAAYEMGYENASAPIVGPTNESRNILRAALDEAGYRYIIGKGYYAFIDLGPWIQAAGWQDSIPMGEYLANEFGLAVVPGAFNSPAGNDWVRFSYAQTPERTRGAAQRLNEALKNLEK